jgi:hypothetical protein
MQICTRTNESKDRGRQHWPRWTTLKWPRCTTLKWPRWTTLKWPRCTTLKWPRCTTLKWPRWTTLNYCNRIPHRAMVQISKTNYITFRVTLICMASTPTWQGFKRTRGCGALLMRGASPAIPWKTNLAINRLVGVAPTLMRGCLTLTPACCHEMMQTKPSMQR